MGDDIGKKVEQIAQMLGHDNIPDNVKELVALLATSLSKKEDNSVQAEAFDADSNDSAAGHEPAGSTELLDKAKKATERYSPSSDPRINLLQAIKPFMNNRRQKKIGNCIQLLQIAGLSRLLNEHEK